MWLTVPSMSVPKEFVFDKPAKAGLAFRLHHLNFVADLFVRFARIGHVNLPFRGWPDRGRYMAATAVLCWIGKVCDLSFDRLGQLAVYQH